MSRRQRKGLYTKMNLPYSSKCELLSALPQTPTLNQHVHQSPSRDTTTHLKTLVQNTENADRKSRFSHTQISSANSSDQHFCELSLGHPHRSSLSVVQVHRSTAFHWTVLQGPCPRERAAAAKLGGAGWSFGRRGERGAREIGGKETCDMFGMEGCGSCAWKQ